MATLREEIIESQKIRSELLKWKLLIVSALGASGLGFTEQGGVRGAYLVLLLIPLVCFYVDLLCRHLSLRIIVIGTFMRIGSCDVETAYECFVKKTASIEPKKLNVFALEEWALEGSTVVLSLLVIGAGLIFPELPEIGLPKTDMSIVRINMQTGDLVRVMFIGSGLTGIILSLIARRRYRRRIHALDVLAENPSVVEEIRSKFAGNAHCREGAPSRPGQA